MSFDALVFAGIRSPASHVALLRRTSLLARSPCLLRATTLLSRSTRSTPTSRPRPWPRRSQTTPSSKSATCVGGATGELTRQKDVLVAILVRLGAGVAADEAAAQEQVEGDIGIGSATRPSSTRQRPTMTARTGCRTRCRALVARPQRGSISPTRTRRAWVTSWAMCVATRVRSDMPD